MNIQTPRGRFAAVAASFIIFFTAFVLLYPRFGLSITFLGILPILMGAWVYGIWAGLLFTFMLYGIDILIIVLLRWGNIQIALLPTGLIGLITGISVSLFMGRHGELSRNSQEESRQRISLLEERTNHSRFLTLLNEILSAALETDDMEAMLKVFANRTGKLFNTNHCFIAFWDDKFRKTIPMAAYGSRSEAFFTSVRQFENNERSLTAAVLDAGHALAIEDIKHSAYISKNVSEKFANGSVLGLPLISGTRKLGAVVLGFDSHHSFTKEEIERAELAASQVSLAVTKALFLDEARKRVHELTGLHNISQAFSLHGDAHKTFGLLTETLAGLLGGKMCIISLYDAATNELLPQVPAYGLSDKRMTALHCPSEMNENTWNLMRSGIIHASSKGEIPPAFTTLAHSSGMNSLLVAPLWDVDGQLLGAIFAANKPGDFTDYDIRVLDILTRQVTAVVQNSRLLEAERTRAEQLAVLHAVAAAATEAADEDQLIECVTMIIGQRLFSDSFGVLLLDDTTQELYLHSSYRVGSFEGLARLPLGIGVTGAVAKSRKPLRLEDISVSPDYLSLYPLTRSELCVPLIVESKLLGVVNTESTKAKAFTAEDEELLTIIAGQLAMAIQRLRTVQAERYQTKQLERSNSLIQALAQVNARASTATDPDGILQTLGNELARLGLRCAIVLSDADDQYVIFRYISLPDRLVQALERISNIKIKNYSIPAKFSPYATLIKDACLINDPLAMLMSWLPDIPQSNAKKILNLVGLKTTTAMCNLPLFTEGRPMGVLWMWGEGLHESDLPTMSLFASQLAAALQNANLLAEVGRLAITDDLTGIFNRRHFFELAEKKFEDAQENRSPFSVLIVDLDHFKSFNDNYGHVIGDQVLRAVAQMMRSAMRQSDIIGRYGGEEFSIILPETTKSSAIYMAERLISQVSDTPIETEAGKLTIKLSIGIAGMTKDTPTLHSLIVRADQAMYLAKRAGRNCLAVK